MSATTPAIPEFSLGIGTRQNGNAVGLFAEQIFLIGAGDGGHIYQTLYPTASGLDAANLTNRSFWQSSQVELQNHSSRRRAISARRSSSAAMRPSCTSHGIKPMSAS
jgi:hypothetical protein